MQKVAIGLGVLGTVVMITAVILGWVVAPNIIETKVEEKVRLIPKTDTWNLWQDIPFPVYLTFYIFHITNPDQVELGMKPIFQEKGPYAYKQRRQRVEITQNDTTSKEDRVQYSDKKTYWFSSEKSGWNKESDLVNVINIPFVAVIHGIRSKMPGLGLEAMIANQILQGETFVRRNVTVGELLFQGFDVSKYTDDALLGSQLPKEFSGGRFGLYKGENGTNSLRFNIHTGVESSEKFGKIITYNGSDQLGYWKPNTSCDQVQGTDGTVFPPFFKKDRKLNVFVTDLCRSLRLEYEEEVTVKDITAYRFTVPKNVLEDPRVNEDNMCYCLNEKKEDCPHSGAMSLEGCRNGAPIMMSTPYFLDGYDGYLNDSGLPKAVREEHFTYLDIEPNSGLLLNAHKRIQVNVDVKLGEGIEAYKNLKKDVLFPVMWADESGSIDDKGAGDLKELLINPMELVDILKWTVLSVGIAIFISGVIIVFYIKTKRDKETE